MIRHSPIVNRVRAHVRRLMTAPGRPKVTTKRLAESTGLSVSQVGNFLRGQYGIALKHLDPLALALGVATSELVRETDYPLFELTEPEARLVEYVRQLPPRVRDELIDVFDCLHGRLPDDRQSVQMFDYWRKLEASERNVVFAAAVRLSEEGFSPEVRAALGIPDVSDGQARKTGKRVRS